LLFAAFCSIGTFGLSAQRGKQGKQKPQDSLRIVTIRRDSTKKDSVRLDTVKKKRTQLDAPVDYKANDSIVFEQNNQAYLYGSSEVDYQKIKLNAERIVMKMDSSTVEAVGRKDSVGKMIGEPVFTDGDAPYQSKTMRYNFKSKRGFITDVTTQQGEGYVTSFNSKKGADGLLYMHNGRRPENHPCKCL
jgi:lipopolysaccharide assembly outer membrane protein LptD (OstA)